MFGPDLDVLGSLVEEVRHVMSETDGVADLQVEQTAGIPQLVIKLDRDRLSRFGISVTSVAELVETALEWNGGSPTFTRKNE